MTTLGAPNGKVISIDLKHPEREHWKTVIPESEEQAGAMCRWCMNTLIANYLADAQSMVELHTRDGEAD